MNSNLNPFHGTTVQSSAVAGFTLTETAYGSNVRLPEHSHQAAYFCFVLQGGFTEHYERQRRACSPSTLLFHPPDEVHSDHFHSKTRCFNLEIAPLDMTAGRLHPRIEPTGFRGGLLRALVTRLYSEFRNMDDLSPLVVEGLMLELIGEASRQSLRSSKADPPWLVQTRDILHQQFRHGLTLSNIAKLVGVHHTHLAREFRRHYRCTVGEYVRQLRVEFACRKLSTSDTPLSEIALAAGFVDQSHFSRTFKVQTGFSPARYRAAFRAR
jgi:AraC family transcriptional regulator